MKKIMIEKTLHEKKVVGSTNKLIAQRLKKEYYFKELKEDKEIAFIECCKLVSTFEEIIDSNKKYNMKENNHNISGLRKNFIKELNDVLYSEAIDQPIKAMILFTWDHVIRKHLKQAIKQSNFLKSQIAILLLKDISVEIEKAGIK